MLRDEEFIQEIESVINTLPKLEDDKWPILPKDIFSLSKPISQGSNPVSISYRSAMIHFSMSVKQIEDYIQEWLDKFEVFFKRIPDAYEANVDIHLSPYTANYKNQNLNYHWKANRDQNGIITWKYKGDPTKLEEICKPVHYAHSYFTEELKNQVIENLQWIGDKIGQEIIIIDRLTTVIGNYDRHFTRTFKLEFTIEDFGVRTSGAIARIEGLKNKFEFRTDCIRRIERKLNRIEFESVLESNISRLITIELAKQK